MLRAEGAFVLAASGYDEAWHFRIYFADHDCALTARECCEARGVDVRFGVENGRSGSSGFGYFGLTECQYETLVENGLPQATHRRGPGVSSHGIDIRTGGPRLGVYYSNDS